LNSGHEERTTANGTTTTVYPNSSKERLLNMIASFLVATPGLAPRFGNL